jgi:hypothetical protein
MDGTEQQKPKTNWPATIVYVVPYLCVVGYLMRQHRVPLDTFIFGAGGRHMSSCADYGINENRCRPSQFACFRPGDRLLSGVIEPL